MGVTGKIEDTIVMRTDFEGVKPPARGKVRDIYDLGDRLILVASDRISAFDVVLPEGIPGKGRVLNTISEYWFGQTADIVPNHLISTDVGDYPEEFRKHRDILEGRSMLVRKTKPLPVECIVRGYVAGSGWKEYKSSGSICGIPLPAGLPESARLDTPIFTPSTKAEAGTHDENISFERAAAILGRDLAGKVRDVSIALYSRARDIAEKKGIIIADTKFEFGIDEKSGELVLIDEALTPDSSRFWPMDEYRPGGPQKSFDKQFVRDYLESLDWDKKPPAPSLPPDVVRKTSEKYKEALERLTA
ncbi:MAG TPA: phosphoribosylaminoimidazolesuccinocarboxamide synthase [Thermodesulfobacteriota bacterium]|nr:phosphoribosylaminoimidazolesuccinocarboxamide synthase [Thermodesulfobacteriota bacterium]